MRSLSSCKSRLKRVIYFVNSRTLAFVERAEKIEAVDKMSAHLSKNICITDRQHGVLVIKDSTILLTHRYACSDNTKSDNAERLKHNRRPLLRSPVVDEP